VGHPARGGIFHSAGFSALHTARGTKVLDVLIGGNHAEVAAWRRAAAIEKTRKNRPDLKLTKNLMAAAEKENQMVNDGSDIVCEL
jgi:tRNA (guanine-N1)-methyltransferase